MIVGTPTQSRLLDYAKNHRATRHRWPRHTREISHEAITTYRAVSIYQLRAGYCIAWINGGQDGLHLCPSLADAEADMMLIIRDLRAMTTNTEGTEP